MRYRKLSKMVKKLEQKRAFSILLKKGVCVWFDGAMKAIKNYYTKDTLTDTEKDEIKDLETLCKSLGIDFYAMVYIDDLGNENL